jgi:oligopeptide/dipeptide ABC transporter ATP-binding protein
MPSPLLAVRDLTVRYNNSREGAAAAVSEASFDLAYGECVAVVGETGCGKSTLSLAILDLLHGLAAVSGSVRFQGRELLGLSEREWRQIRGAQIGAVFQDPHSALNCVLTVGVQITESLRAHRALSRSQARELAPALLAEVGIPDPVRCMDLYGHELSGGMCQRVGIALAICHRPSLLIADEPTSALDPTVQVQILDLLKDLQRQHGIAVLLVSHDWAVVQECADAIAVMYHGRIVEWGPAAQVSSSPGHPYTQALLDCRWNLENEPRPGLLPVIPGAPLPINQTLTGCDFAPRCVSALPVCKTQAPEAATLGESHWAHCHLLKQ